MFTFFAAISAVIGLPPAMANFPAPNARFQTTAKVGLRGGGLGFFYIGSQSRGHGSNQKEGREDKPDKLIHGTK